MHNDIAICAAWLAGLAVALGLVFVFEQPLTSLLWLYDPIAEMLFRHGARQAMVALKAFGAQSLKPLHLKGTAPWLEELAADAKWRLPYAAPSSSSLYTQTFDADGRRLWVSGNSRELANSGKYPGDFCMLVARKHQRSMQRLHGGGKQDPELFSLMDD
jgi:hypothetical protein